MLNVNPDRFTAMLEGFFTSELEISRIWFQQDRATSHTSNQSIAIARQMFPDRLISRRGDIQWLPRSDAAQT